MIPIAYLMVRAASVKESQKTEMFGAVKLKATAMLIKEGFVVLPYIPGRSNSCQEAGRTGDGRHSHAPGLPHRQQPRD